MHYYATIENISKDSKSITTVKCWVNSNGIEMVNTCIQLFNSNFMKKEKHTQEKDQRGEVSSVVRLRILQQLVKYAVRDDDGIEIHGFFLFLSF